MMVLPIDSHNCTTKFWFLSARHNTGAFKPCLTMFNNQKMKNMQTQDIWSALGLH